MERYSDMRHPGFLMTTLLALFWFLPGCSAKLIPTAPSASVRSDSTYIGTWNWVRSIGGYAGRTETPESNGYTMRIELTSDSVYREYRSDIVTISRRFSIRRETRPDSPDSFDVISFPGVSVEPPMHIRLTGRDTLNLVDQYMDGYSRFYSRRR